MNYSHLQIREARRLARETVVPALRARCKPVAGRIAVAVTGSASFSAADRFSDFDGTIFLREEDAREWLDPVARVLGELDLPDWAGVQDATSEFTALTYKQMGVPVPNREATSAPPEEISAEAAWHVQRYVSICDENGSLEEAKTVAASLSARELQKLEATARARVRTALGQLAGAEGTLCRQVLLADVLCWCMRHCLLNVGELFPQEKWLWWWFCRQESAELADHADMIREVVASGLGQPGMEGRFSALLDGDSPGRPPERPRPAPCQVASLWRDLWWQDNCLYHDIMRRNRVGAFIRVGRALERIQRLCEILNDSPVDLDRGTGPGTATRVVLSQLVELRPRSSYVTWRYQIGYAIEALRDVLLERGLIGTPVALKPYL